MLELRGLRAGYGALEVLHDVDLDVAVGDWFAVVGAVGAGKSTLLGAIAGLLPLRGGDVRFDGVSIGALPPDTRLRLGIALAPEGRRLFAGMTVRENLRAGAFVVGDRHQLRQRTNRVFDLFPVLAERRDQVAGTLSGGEQQMCAIGRALMSAPRLLLIDECSLGLAPGVVERLFAALCDIRAAGATLVTVEQNVDLAFEHANRACLLQRGSVALLGPANRVRAHPDFERLFMGY